MGEEKRIRARAIHRNSLLKIKNVQIHRICRSPTLPIQQITATDNRQLQGQNNNMLI